MTRKQALFLHMFLCCNSEILVRKNVENRHFLTGFDTSFFGVLKVYCYFWPFFDEFPKKRAFFLVIVHSLQNFFSGAAKTLQTVENRV